MGAVAIPECYICVSLVGSGSKCRCGVFSVLKYPLDHSLGIEHSIIKFKDVIGLTMDEIAQKNASKRPSNKNKHSTNKR